jgi:hypothetical protein
MAGLVHLPRMIDKIRASHTGRLGPYMYPCPMDRMVLEFLGLSAEDLAARVRGAEDRRIEQDIEARCLARGLGGVEKSSLNHRILSHGPEPGEKTDYFMAERNRIDPSRTDIVTWAGLIDLEEGRAPL